MPSASVSQTPSPDTKVTSCRAYAGSSAEVVSSELTRPPPSRRSSRRRRRGSRPTAACSLGTIPPPSSPASSRRSASATRIVEATAPPSSKPGTSVTKRSLSAPSPTESAAAASSAFTFSGPDAERCDDGDESGRKGVLDRRRCAREAVSRRARARGRARLRARSRPRRAARAIGPIAEHTSALTEAKDSRTTASAASLVTRRPSMNLTSSPARSSSAEICGPAPWTTQTSWLCASASASVAASPATAPPTLSDDPAHVR